MANIINQYGQVKLGVRYVSAPLTSTLWGNIYSVYNADSVGSSSLKTSLFAAYNGESNTNDSFGSNNGTAQGGLTYTSGKIGNAFQFNGTTSYVSLPNNSFKFTGNFSVSLWFYCKTSSNAQTLINGYDYNGSASGGWVLNIFGNTNFLEYQTYVNTQANSKSRYRIPFNTSTYNNQWVHIVLTRVSSTSTKVYINGTEVSGSFFTGSVSDNPTYLTNCYSEIGGMFVTSGGFINPCDNGTKIDAVNVWQKELTATEITELYNSGNGAQYITDSFYKPTTSDALNTYNGTAVGGLTYGVGKVGTAFQFNGSNSAIRLPVNSMSFTNDFSISAWVNIPSGYSGLNSITILWNINGAWFSNPKGFRLAIIGTQVNFGIFNGTDTYNSLNWNDTNQTIIKQDSGWVHIAAVRKKSTSSKIYVNGVLKASNTDVNDAVYSSTYQTPNIGNAYMLNSSGTVTNNDSWAFNGSKIDALSAWNKELSATEITELYNSGNGKQYTN